MQKDEYSAKTETYLARQEELRRAQERADEMTAASGGQRKWSARWATRAVEMTLERRGRVRSRDQEPDIRLPGER